MKSHTSLKNQKQNNFLAFLLLLFPFQAYIVHGKSMLPTYTENQKILFLSLSHFFLNLKVGDVIVMLHPRTKQKILKRITEIKSNKVFVTGDNIKESTDSRDFGWVNKKNIIGKAIYPV